MREAHFKLVPTQLLLLCPMAPQGGAKGAEFLLCPMSPQGGAKGAELGTN